MSLVLINQPLHLHRYRRRNHCYHPCLLGHLSFELGHHSCRSLTAANRAQADTLVVVLGLVGTWAAAMASTSAVAYSVEDMAASDSQAAEALADQVTASWAGQVTACLVAPFAELPVGPGVHIGT